MNEANSTIGDFISSELSRIPKMEDQPAIPTAAPPAQPGDAAPISERASTKEKGERHSIHKCNCEKCQEKRRQLAIRFGLLSDEASSETQEDLSFIDEEFIGKLCTTPHRLRQVTVLTKFQSEALAKAWEVSDQSIATYGKIGNAILNKYLRRTDFKYKSELIGGAYLLSDLGVRLMHEKQLMILEQNKRALDQKEKALRNNQEKVL